MVSRVRSRVKEEEKESLKLTIIQDKALKGNQCRMIIVKMLRIFPKGRTTKEDTRRSIRTIYFVIIVNRLSTVGKDFLS